MKKLLLLRHAKAENGHGKSDFERSLTDRGRFEAAEIAGRFHDRGDHPQFILTSSAHRAKATAEAVSIRLPSAKMAVNLAIYEANISTLQRIISQLPDQYNYVILVGHNPGLSELIYELSGQTRDLYTCGLALIEFTSDQWSMINAETGKLTWYDMP